LHYNGEKCGQGSVERPWQEVNYILAFWGKRVQTARKAYLSYVEEGFQQGRRKELVGGGLIRSQGGWSKVKRLSSEGRAHAISDERILEESDFVDSMLSGAGEKLDWRYELQALGYDLGRIATRAAEIFEMGVLKFFQKDARFARSRQEVSPVSGLPENWGCRWLIWDGRLKRVFRGLGMPLREEKPCP